MAQEDTDTVNAFGASNHRNMAREYIALSELPEEFEEGVDRGDGHRYYGRTPKGQFRTAQNERSPSGIRETDLEQHLVAKACVFHTNDEEEMHDYEKVMTDCTNGLASFGESEKQWDPESKQWFIFVRWYEVVAELREALKGKL